jgi:YD repeat-containing protein
VTNSFNGNLISAFDYANDALGRRNARLDSLPAGVAITNAFGYNARSEVTTAAMGTNTYGYVFDPIGNRITATNNAEVASYTSNGLNQYTNIVNAVVALPTYDDDGNMTSSGDGWHYVWNGENRLILASNETALLSYAYDHQGRMVWKKVSHGGGEAQSWEEGKAVSYLWDNYNIIAETSEENEISNTTYNIWGLDINGTLQGAGGVGGLLAVVKDNATVYFTCYDGNGNITEYVSINGTITAHREYDPFGGTVFASVDANAFTHWFSTKPWCSLMAHSEYQYRKYYGNRCLNSS